MANHHPLYATGPDFRASVQQATDLAQGCDLNSCPSTLAQQQAGRGSWLARTVCTQHLIEGASTP